MNIRSVLVGLCAITLVVVPVGAAVAQERVYAPVDRPGPALSESPDNLAASIRCTADAATADNAPVLLTAGTTVTSRENFGWNWITALQDAGFPVCTVDPVVAPQNMGDHQIRAEYVVHAIRHAYEAGGQRPISILGHSQGGQIMRWGLRFWPDTRPMVENVISMAPTNHGSVAVRSLCVPNCAPALWQQIDDSAYIRALNSRQETFAGISYTNVYTKADEFVQPNLDDSGTSSLHTGDGRITNVALQDVCPASVSEHLAIGTYDPIAYALGMDALTHDGPAEPSRIDGSVCTQSFMPGVNPLTFPTDYATASARITQELTTAERVDAEPELRCYVFANCPAAESQAADQHEHATRSPDERPAAEDTPTDQEARRTSTGDDPLPATGGGASAAALGILCSPGPVFGTAGARDKYAALHESPAP